MIDLNNVTLVCVDGRSRLHNLSNSIKAIMFSSKEINFGEKLFIGPKIEDNHLKDSLYKSNITYVEIEDLDSINKYSNFILKRLYDFIKTDFCLIIQSDGFVLNPKNWDDKFLNYDYIGAPWTHHCILTSGYVFENIKRSGKYSNVGNGGFSLRSKKLLYETKNAPFDWEGPEDNYICINFYDYFVDKGIKFAPIELAATFSLEHWVYGISVNIENTLGFHGNSGMINEVAI